MSAIDNPKTMGEMNKNFNGIYVFGAVLFIWLTMPILYGCKHERASVEAVEADTVYVYSTVRDTVCVRDTVFVKIKAPDVKHVSFIMIPPMLDSVATCEQMDKALCVNDIKIGEAELYSRNDLEYLPYLLLSCSSYNKALNKISGYIVYLYISMCTAAIDDKMLFCQGREIVEHINRNNCNRLPCEYPDSFDSGGPFSFRDWQWFKPTAIDTLRVRAIVHNDRGALEKLERYYKKTGDDKGIAVYYKVMLGYEGNGDLAERFYKVLEPYFDKTPEFRIAVREVLLRAAHCDHDRRAQELCDSLGFSLCDYRLPVVSEPEYRNEDD